jgi:hypothetical protein
MSRIVAHALTNDDATAQEQLGKVYVDYASGKAYRYVLAEDAALANGDVVEFSDTSGYEVTNDRAGGSSLGRFVAGVAIGTISDGQYGWIQVSGKHSAVKTDGAVAAGDRLVPHATADGQADTEASGSTVAVTSGQVFGFALATDSGTTSAGTVAAMIRCL